MQNKKNLFIIITLLIIIIISLVLFKLKDNTSPKYFKKQATLFQEKLIKKESVVYNIIDELKKDPNLLIDFNKINDKYKNILNDDNITILIFNNKNLAYWSDNINVFANINDSIVFKNNKEYLININNKTFEVIKYKQNNYIIVGLILIKNNFKHVNEFIENGFADNFGIKDNCILSENKNGNNIYSKDGNYLFSLIFSENKSNSNENMNMIFYIITSLIIFLLFIITIKTVNNLSINKYIKLLLSILVVFASAISFQCYNVFVEGLLILKVLKTISFSSQLFTVTLGNLYIISLLLLLCCYWFKFIVIKAEKISKIHSIIHTLVGNILIIIVFASLAIIIKNIVLSSFVTDSLTNIFKLKLNIVFNLVITSIFSISAYLLLLTTLGYLFKTSSKPKIIITILLISVILFVFSQYISLFLGIDRNLLISSLLFSLMIVTLYTTILKETELKINIKSVFIFIFIFSIFATFLINQYVDIKEKEIRKSIAFKLNEKNDPLIEMLFVENEAKIKSDTLIRNHLKNNIYDKKLENYIKNKYFGSFWSKYDIQFTFCRSIDSLSLKPNNIKVPCEAFFFNIIKSGKPTISKNLYRLNSNTIRKIYIAHLSLIENMELGIGFNIYIEFISKYVPAEFGYPNLLIDKNDIANSDIKSYSYSKYVNKELVNQFGNYFYSLNGNLYNQYESKLTFFEKNNYNHLVYKPDSETIIVISKKNEKFIDIISPFSYIFILCFLIFALMMIFETKNFFRLFRYELTLGQRFNSAMIFIVLLSSVFIGIITFNYIINIYSSKNKEYINEKSHSLINEINDKLSKYYEINNISKEQLTDILINLSNTYFIDLNLYDTGGNLIASSREAVFNEGILSRRIDPVAYYNLKTNAKSIFVNNENIGKLTFNSVYASIKNSNNELIAYLNIPFLAKKNQQKNEISTLIVTYSNIYILLLIIAILIAMFLTRNIINPLNIITDKMKMLKLGRKNEKIEWKSEDEIGALISEYNRMIDELAMSAELLSKSERQSAWNEMAKQIAHEIKNPLTPMKLSVQYLKKSYQPNSDEWKLKFERFTETIIEQIDNLNKIATAFSDFAQLPKLKPEQLNLSVIIKQSIELYKDYHNISINFAQDNNGDEYFITADRSQLMRMFNNLLSNAVQAIDENKEGFIKVSLSKTGNNYNIAIADNGRGISDEVAEKIFVPYFTTKTSGMGLGLAIVKAIAENHSGTISFDTQIGLGTTFSIVLPAHQLSNS